MTTKKRTTQRRAIAMTARPSKRREAAAPDKGPAGSKPRRQPATPGSPAMVVVVGASAGGVEAFKQFLEPMPADTGLAFVLIPHLDPRQDSHLVQVLARHTKMTVSEIEHNRLLLPNEVHVIPPNKRLAMNHGRCLLEPLVAEHGAQTTIDHALQSVAEDLKEKAIGIILSGTGAHGTEGLRAIKRAGGLVLVQDPRTATFDQMPRNALSSGIAVDYVLPPEAMAAALLTRIHRQPRDREQAEHAIRQSVPAVLGLLVSRTEADFRTYRKSMVARRIQRRMALLHLTNIKDYLERLNADNVELHALRKDLLIGVTAFFREPGVYAALAEHVLPPLIERASADEPLRVWVPGCSTGEEAYSMAMLLIEQFEAMGREPHMQIYATDVDDASLRIARRGSYSKGAAGFLSREQLRRFFTKKPAHHFQVKDQLRASITFAAQDLVKDPPFSRIDLISCRNVLIYLEPEVQSAVISRFHFALKSAGYLVLGKAESARVAGFFEPIARKWRIYRKLTSARRPPMASLLGQTARLLSPQRFITRCERRTENPPELMRAILLKEFVPAAALVNSQLEILCVQGPIANYLELPPGELTRDLLDMCREGLRAKLRAACKQALDTKKSVFDPDARVRRNDGYVRCSITVRPIDEANNGGRVLLIVLQDRHLRDGDPNRRALGSTRTSAALRELEDELRATRADQRSMMEELESANEELRASNEEILAMNEELQSANEELETSKEELQMLNAELSTVNRELKAKIEALDSSNNDLTNLMAATDLALVFLDTHLRIKRFTPSTTALLNLLESDAGRPFRDIAPRFTDADLERDAQHVLTTFQQSEKEIEAEGNRWFLRRIQPHRTTDQRIAGVAISFIDITARREVEERVRNLNVDLERRVAERTTALRHSEERVRAILDATADAVITVDRSGTITTFNKSAERIFGYSAQEIIGSDVGVLLPLSSQGPQPSPMTRYLAARAAHIIGPVHELIGCRKNGSTFPIQMTVNEVAGTNLLVGLVRDMTEYKAMQEEILNVAVLEQRRIGQELHDGTQQELAGLGLLAQGLCEALEHTGPPDAHALAARLASGIEHANLQVRSLARGMIPVPVDKEGLAAALADLARDTTESSGIECHFESTGPIDLDDDTAATHLFRIAQEALCNALKHAEAQSLKIRLTQLEGQLTLEIADDGTGINSQHIPPASTGPGVGLRVMAHRCMLIGGSFAVRARQYGSGTRIICTLPLDHE